ncbi:15059_t:CDS:1, partial [Entrophospora sp. SA101]
MSATTICINSFNCTNVPYNKYFEFFPYDKWSLARFFSHIIDNYQNADKRMAH